MPSPAAQLVCITDNTKENKHMITEERLWTEQLHFAKLNTLCIQYLCTDNPFASLVHFR